MSTTRGRTGYFQVADTTQREVARRCITYKSPKDRKEELHILISSVTGFPMTPSTAYFELINRRVRHVRFVSPDGFMVQWCRLDWVRSGKSHKFGLQLRLPLTYQDTCRSMSEPTFGRTNGSAYATRVGGLKWRVRNPWRAIYYPPLTRGDHWHLNAHFGKHRIWRRTR